MPIISLSSFNWALD